MPQYLTPSFQVRTGPTSRVLLFHFLQFHSSVKLSKELEGDEGQGLPRLGVGRVGEEGGWLGMDGRGEGAGASTRVVDGWLSIEATRLAMSHAGKSAVSSSIQCRFMAPSLALSASILKTQSQFTPRRPR